MEAAQVTRLSLQVKTTPLFLDDLEIDRTRSSDTSRCWWTCGGCTRPTDIVACPDKLDWGVSYDDGPSPYTPKLVSFLHDHNITATFYVVGSRVISRPEMLQTEYMLGHEM